MPRTRTSKTAQAILGSIVREARSDRKLTQSELAARLDVNPTYITNIEAGRVNVTIGQLATIAEALNAGLELRLPLLPEEPVRISPPDRS
jgi:transcriptional regulator with XRE-family HTH domain